jgi:hypothetical protein
MSERNILHAVKPNTYRLHILYYMPILLLFAFGLLPLHLAIEIRLYLDFPYPKLQKPWPRKHHISSQKFYLLEETAYCAAIVINKFPLSHTEIE